MRTAGPFVFAALLGLMSAAALRAHDFWIEPSTFTPEPSQRVIFRLRVGQELRGDPLPRDPNLLRRFVAVGTAGETPVLGRAYMEPAGVLMFPAPGLQVIVYDSGRSPLALE